MPAKKHVTLGQIAERAGYSRSTVSRALRNHPHIPVQTCKRVQALAKEMGWRPDPEASRLMQYLQSTKHRRVESALALLNDYPRREDLVASPYINTLVNSARTRAESLGFHLEEIWLRQPGMTPRRIHTILRTRGIKGILIPPEHEPRPHLELDWKGFATVATTTTAEPERMNRVLPDNYYNMHQLMQRVLDLGYRRPLLVTMNALEIRMEHAPRCMFLSLVLRAGLDPLPVFVWNDPVEPGDSVARLNRMVGSHRPDVLIVADTWMLEHLPEGYDLPAVCFSHGLSVGIGVEQRPEAIGSAAVDVLSAHVIRGEVGLPSIPRVLHIRGEVVGTLQPATTPS